jgi:hypothetical protein
MCLHEPYKEDEMSDLRNCPDCDAAPGEKHDFGCDWETCPICGGQMLMCASTKAHGDKTPTADHPERITWEGESALHVAARENGFYCYEDPNGYGNPDLNYGHMPCDKDHPRAHLDLNRAYDELAWDPQAKKYVKEAV